MKILSVIVGVEKGKRLAEETRLMVTGLIPLASGSA
jgi:hypothetical protein